MKIIGFTGRKRAGKDTAADVLVREGYELIKFAGALKAMIRAYLTYIGVSPQTIERMIEGDLKELSYECFVGRTPRFVMQTLGTEWGRDIINTNLWVNACMRRCSMFDNVVISDCRFPNEVAAIQEQGGKIICIVRPEPNPSWDDMHLSETGIDALPYDHIIVNNSTVAALHDKIIEIVKNL
jgi:hypothetical protein